MHNPAPALFIALAALVAVPGCGGGGGGVKPEPPPCIPTHSGICRSPAEIRAAAAPLAEDYRREENVANQWGLRDVGAHWAYAHLDLIAGEDAKPGAGVTIGFIDSGIDRHHPMFAGATISETFLPGASDETVAGFDLDDYSHGTAVASIAAGRPTNRAGAPQGVAWGADIAMFAIPLGSGGGLYVPVSPQELFDGDSRWASRLARVFRAGNDIDILNMSIGFPGIIDRYTAEDLRENFSETLARLAQAGAGEKTILVWAAGNAHGDDCTTSPADRHCVNGRIDAVSVEILPGLAARIPELRSHSIAVVAVKDGASGPVIADFSNRCGIAAGYCIAAPGKDVWFAYFGYQRRDFARSDGTSFAAPMVAGGLAIMKQLFRDQLSNTELVSRLLVTADNTGRYANRSVYGRGLMDLKAATSPVGVLDVPAGNRAGGPGTPLQTTAVQPGSALGDGLAQSLAGREIAALDALGAPFWFNLDDFVGVASAPPTRSRLRDLMAPVSDSGRGRADGFGGAPGEHLVHRRALSERWRLGLLEAPAGAEGGHLGLAGRALALSWSDHRAFSGTAFTTGGEFERAPASGAVFSWGPAGSPFGLHSGWVGERETLLGGTAAGAFGTLAGDALFAGIRGDAEIGRWRLSADAEIGSIDPTARDGFVTGISPLITSTFALRARGPLAGRGTLHLSVSQPLRVERGRASLAVPVGRTKAGQIVRRQVSADLAPSGRQIDIAAQWRWPLAAGELRLGAVVTHEPAHRAAQDLELTLLSGWRWTF